MTGESAELKHRRLVFQNVVFQVFSDHLAQAGFEVQQYLVVAPRTERKDLIAGVAVLPVCGERIVLLKRFRHPVGRVLLEVPRGFVDRGEEPSHAAARELLEETGLNADPGGLVSLGIYMPDSGVIAGRIALFAAVNCRRGARGDKEEIGIQGLVSFSLSEAEQLLHDMSLEDSATCVALHRFFCNANLRGLAGLR